MPNSAKELLVANAVLDPRGMQEKRLLQLASRVSLEELKKGPIVFYDNTKLGFCNYMEVFRRIKANFEQKGIANFIDFRETVRGKTTQELRGYARKLAAASACAGAIADPRRFGEAASTWPVATAALGNRVRSLAHP